jgi:MFS family permease
MATAACGLAGSFAQLLLARSGVGAGEAALNPAAYSLLSDTFPKRRLSFAISVFGTGSYIGGTASLLLGGLVISGLPESGMVVPLFGHLEPWRLAFLIAGVPGIFIALLAWSMVDPPRRERLASSESSRATLRFLGANRGFFVGHFFGFALMAASANAYQAWAPTHLTQQFNISIGEVVMILAPIGLVAGIAGALIAGWITDKLFARGVTDAHLRFFLFSIPLQAGCMVVAVTATELWIFIVFITMFVMASGYAGAGPAALQIVTPNNYRGQVSAAYLFVFNLVGTGIGPTMVGAITTFMFKDDGKVGWAVATTTLVLAPLSAFALASAMGPMRRAVTAAAVWQDGN